MMNLDQLLFENGIDPTNKKVLALRHKPSKADSSEFRANFISLIGERPNLFNEFQSTQNVGVERKFEKASYLASFVGHLPKQALFVGIFRVGDSSRWTKQKFWRHKAHTRCIRAD
jgi:hypothetical protein